MGLTEDGWSLRGYQREAAENCLHGGSGVVGLPCGAGKTIVGAAAMAMAGATTLILVTNTVSARQWKSELLKRTHLVRIDPNVMMGTIEALHRRPRTIQRQSQRFGKAGKNTLPVGLRICASTRSHPVTLPRSEIPVSTSPRLRLRASQSRLHRIQNIKIPHENRK